MIKHPGNSPVRNELSVMSRRAFVVGLPLLAAGCAGANYGSVTDGGHTISAVDMTAMDSGLMRQEVAWSGKEKPGSIVVNVPQRRLYLVQAGGRAVRYGVGVGRSEGMNFRGTATIGRKEKWPHWTPTANMMRAHPDVPVLFRRHGRRHRTTRSGRALCTFIAAARTRIFRLHGTTEPETIGTAVSTRLHPAVQPGHHRSL